MSEEKEKKVSPYTILNKWLYDGSATSKLPEDLVKDKSISNMYLLYHFRCSPLNVIISELFNNWGLFSLDRIEVLYFLKECVYLSGYKPPYVNKVPSKKNKLHECLKERYPFLKSYEVFDLVELIDKSDEKDAVYETFGIYNPARKKTTKAQQETFKKLNVVEDKKEIKEVINDTTVSSILGVFEQ